MPGASQPRLRALLDADFGSGTPATWYLAAFLTMPAADGTGGVEPAVGSYARVAVTNNGTNWPVATTVSGVTTVESTYFLSGGTTADTVTAALAAIASAKYGRQAWAHHDATALDAIAAQLATQAGPTVQLRQQFVSCTPASLGTAITLATGRNVPRGSMLWIYNSPMPPPDAAAQEAAARINGDVTTGVTNPLPGEGTDPASNLIGLELKSIAAQYFQSEQPTSAEIESALNNGLTPLAPSLVNAGKTAVVRSITMRSLASGQPNYAVLDTCYVTAPDFIADDLQGYFAVRYRGCKLGPNSASGEGPKIANVVTPDMIRADVIAKLYGYEAQGITINVAAHVDEVIVDTALTMATMMRGDIGMTEELTRRAIAGSERLQLPILRAQLRWMEASLAVWHGGFDLAKEHFRTAVAVHEDTQLYVAGSGALAMMALATEQGVLGEFIDTGGLPPNEWARLIVEEFSDNGVMIMLAAGVAAAGTAGAGAVAGAAGGAAAGAVITDMLLNSESTSGFKQHILRSEDA